MGMEASPLGIPHLFDPLSHPLWASPDAVPVS